MGTGAESHRTIPGRRMIAGPPKVPSWIRPTAGHQYGMGRRGDGNHRGSDDSIDCGVAVASVAESACFHVEHLVRGPEPPEPTARNCQAVVRNLAPDEGHGSESGGISHPKSGRQPPSRSFT